MELSHLPELPGIYTIKNKTNGLQMAVAALWRQEQDSVRTREQRIAVGKNG